MSQNVAGYALVAVLTVGLSAQVSPAASDFPTDDQVLTYVTQTLDWYHHLAVTRQIATDPVDLVFLEENRGVAAQVVQLAFEAAPVLAEASPARSQTAKAPAAPGVSPDLPRLLQMKISAELGSHQAGQQIESIKKQLLSARGAERRNLQAALDAAQSRLDLMQAGLATLREVIGFTQAAGSGDLRSRIENLARTVPEVMNPATAASEPRSPDSGAAPKPQPSGLISRFAEVSALTRKLRVLDEEILRTETLRRDFAAFGAPLVPSIEKRMPSFAGDALASGDIDGLRQEKARWDELTAMVKTLSPAIVALDKQKVLLDSYSARLKHWRAAVAAEDDKAWRDLLLRASGLTAFLVGLLAIGTVARRAIRRHVHDSERRHILLIIERIVLWFVVVVVAALTLASDLSSMATFLGLLTAGLALAMQSVLTSVLGYFVLVGRRGIRVGDRVQFSGVAGDVIDIGWLQFRVREVDKGTQQATGAVVTFSNSFVFAAPAIGLATFCREGLKHSSARQV